MSHRRAEAALPSDTAGWRTFFSAYGHVVLVANSDAVDIAELRARFANGALFVFFNKTYKVLRDPFDRPALLVARSSAAGANIVYRREVAEVVRPFDRTSFRGIANLRAAPGESFSPEPAFEGRSVGFLDLADALAGIYPANRLPSSGFALAVWLAEQRLPSQIHLAGFSAKRSERWKLFQAHDWTYEQTVQRLLARAGTLSLGGEAPAPLPLIGLTERFPEIGAERLGLTVAEVLSERLANTEAAVDRLLSLTRWQAKLDGLFRTLKPKTRKQRLAKASEGERDAGSLAKIDPGD